MGLQRSADMKICAVVTVQDGGHLLSPLTSGLCWLVPPGRGGGLQSELDANCWSQGSSEVLTCQHLKQEQVPGITVCILLVNSPPVLVLILVFLSTK